MKNEITIQGAECLYCGDIIFSRAKQDLRKCSCNTLAIGEGPFMPTLINTKSEEPNIITLILPLSYEELYDDWNLQIDKHGLISYDNEDEINSWDKEGESLYRAHQKNFFTS